MSSTWQGKIANCWSCSKTDQTRCNSDDQPYEHQLPFPYTKQELSKWAVQTGCTQQHCLCYKYPKLKSKHRNSQTAKHRTQNTYPGPKSMRLIATHNGGSKNRRTNNSLIYYQVKISWKNTGHNSLVYYKPRVPSSSCDAHAQQAEAAYFPQHISPTF